MNRLFPLLVAFVLADFLFGASPVCANPQWKTGDMWNLQVQVPGKVTYIVHAIIGGVETVDGAACWQVTFLPGNGAPPDLKDKRHRVIVNQQTGQPVRAFKVADKQPIALEMAGDNRFMTGLPDGMPIELFNGVHPTVGKFPIAGTERAVEIRKQDLGDHFIIEQALFENGVEQWLVRQEWGVGEKWWHTYQRLDKTSVTLLAHRMNAPPYKGQLAAKKDQDPKALAAKFPLRIDPRLRAKIGRIGSDAELAGFFERLHAATGCKLVLAENLMYHDPKFAEVSVADAPAWMAMELLAKRDLDDGRWVKTDDGYRLEGTSRRMSTPPTPSRGWIAWTVAGGAVLVLAAVFVWRRRARKTP